MLRFIFFLLGISSFCNAQSLTICADCEYKTIKSAISVAMPHDTLIISSGTYTEGNIIINKPLTLLGEGLPVLDGKHETEILSIFADSVNVIGIKFQNVGTSYTADRSAVSLEKCDGCIVKDNVLEDTFFGIHFKNSKNGKIINNKIIGKAEKEMSSGNAIHIWYCKNMIVENNYVAHHRDGIYFEFVDNSKIIGNVSEFNLRYGLHFMFSDHDEYIGNTFCDNGAGVAVMFSDFIDMTGNNFIENWGTSSYGLLLKEIRDSNISNNIFEKNTIGVYGESAIRITFKNNLFKKNGWALKIRGSSTDNTFEQNNFISNTFDVTTDASRNQNTYQRNYWSGYSGYDLDHDGVGDVPYRPVSLFSYVISRSPTSIVLLRSLFIDILDFAEKVTPAITPATLSDSEPLMKMIDL